MTIICERGTFWNNGVCKPCPRGYYQSEYGKVCCETCPEGNSTVGYGSRSSTDCVPDPKELYPLHLGYWDDEKEEKANVDVIRCEDVKEKENQPIGALNVIVFLVMLLILGGMCFFCFNRFFGQGCIRF
ncbi:uncharacterized protein LOC131956120 [Physella acuta]|uniref:uncharacterized protein LOC131956120 n=1 Tax=Physella acuta TaxID=109671 RepID=UPI0027DE8978|nr:uncharacterized protein LOC131956120 [Physella acuta]